MAEPDSTADVQDVESLEYLEDVIVRTGVKRADWLIGITQMSREIGRSNADIGGYIRNEELPVTYIRSSYPGMRAMTPIIERKVLVAWMEKRVADKQAEAQKHSAANGAALNGTAAVAADVRTVVLKEGSPLLSVEEGKALARNMYDLYTVERELRKDIAALASAVDANTKAVRDHIKEMKDFFGPAQPKP